MPINFYTTNQLPGDLYTSLIESFNKAFGLQLTKEYFDNYYLSTPLGESLHVLLEEDGIVAGVFTVMPMAYTVSGKHQLLGLAVGTFILQEYRTDPLMLKRMFNKMKPHLLERNIEFIYAIPNDNVYKYWKAVVKWNDIAELDYYIHPVSATKLLKFQMYPINKTISKLLNILTIFRKNREYKISKNIKIVRDNYFNSARLKYSESVEDSNIKINYRVHDEKGIKIAYILDYNPRTIFALERGVKLLSDKKDSGIDLIAYIGLSDITPLNMLKLPKKLEPRKLYFSGIDLTSTNEGLNFFDRTNWEIELYNFDVK